MTMAKQDLKDRMKQSLGGSISPRQSIFSETVPVSSPKVQSVQSIEPKAQPAMAEEKRQTKADLFTERVTLVINAEQRDRVESLAKAIQRNGLKKPERITANTVMRCLIDLLDQFDADVSLIKSEEELKDLFKRNFKK